MPANDPLKLSTPAAYMIRPRPEGRSGAPRQIAASGHLAPTAGALLQEAIDVAVILNALRASRGMRGSDA